MLERCLMLDPNGFPEAWVKETIDTLLEGAVVVHPTETVHGFGCRADSREALERIYRLKGRDPAKGFILLTPGIEWIEMLSTKPHSKLMELAARYWPGSLTLVFDTSSEARRLYPGLGVTVAVRQTPHPFTSRVVEALRGPMVSTSLNRAGSPAPDDPRRFLETLDGVIELAVIDPSAAKEAKPSSVVTVGVDGRLVMLREGALTVLEIKAATGLEFSE